MSMRCGYVDRVGCPYPSIHPSNLHRGTIFVRISPPPGKGRLGGCCRLGEALANEHGLDGERRAWGWREWTTMAGKRARKAAEDRVSSATQRALPMIPSARFQVYVHRYILAFLFFSFPFFVFFLFFPFFSFPFFSFLFLPFCLHERLGVQPLPLRQQSTAVTQSESARSLFLRPPSSPLSFSCVLVVLSTDIRRLHIPISIHMYVAIQPCTHILYPTVRSSGSSQRATAAAEKAQPRCGGAAHVL